PMVTIVASIFFIFFLKITNTNVVFHVRRSLCNYLDLHTNTNKRFTVNLLLYLFFSLFSPAPLKLFELKKTILLLLVFATSHTFSQTGITGFNAAYKAFA